MGSSPTFLCDGMLGSLARWLRLVGFDTAYADSKLRDEEVLAQSRAEGRILLTRDQDLARRARTAGSSCQLLEDGSVESQIRSLVRGGTLELDPRRFFSRCTRCNGPLRATSREAAGPRLPARILELHSEFWECPQCGHIYWQGTHVEEILRKLSGLVDEKGT